MAAGTEDLTIGDLASVPCAGRLVVLATCLFPPAAQRGQDQLGSVGIIHRVWLRATVVT
jgi:hypothetical protein